MGSFWVWKTQQASRGSLATCWIKERCFRQSSTGFGKSVVFRAFSIVYSYVEPTNQSRKNRMLSQAILSVCTAALFLAWEPQTYFFSLRTTRLRIVGLINKISTKRIHIEEKIWGNFSSICLRSQWFITPCCLIISETINVLMTVDACRVLLLLLSGSSQESMLWRALS